MLDWHEYIQNSETNRFSLQILSLWIFYKEQFCWSLKSKNLTKDLKTILLDHQNNYVESLSIDDNAAKSFNNQFVAS